MRHLAVLLLLLLANIDYLWDVCYYLIKRIEMRLKEMYFGDRSSEHRAIQQALLKDPSLSKDFKTKWIITKSSLFAHSLNFLRHSSGLQTVNSL
jgi:hypothetical protein